jgi:hypothetical protein
VYSLPKRKRPKAGKTDFFIRHPKLNGFNIFVKQGKMINRYLEIRMVYRLQHTGMMGGQNQWGANRPENLVINGSHFSNLNG